MVKVLFIDDEPAAHRTLELVLPDPYVLISAYSARRGMDVVHSGGPDVVLLDINLPDKDGIAVLREIQARPCPPPVVMLTALSEPRLVKEAILAGACDYIVKPIDAASCWARCAQRFRGPMRAALPRRRSPTR